MYRLLLAIEATIGQISLLTMLLLAEKLQQNFCGTNVQPTILDTTALWVTKVGGGKPQFSNRHLEIFWWFFDRRFGAQNFNFIPEFLQINFSPKFCVFHENFATRNLEVSNKNNKKIFWKDGQLGLSATLPMSTYEYTSSSLLCNSARSSTCSYVQALNQWAGFCYGLIFDHICLLLHL